MNIILALIIFSIIILFHELGHFHIAGREVVLGEPLIMLPDCRFVSIEELMKIELG